MKFLDYTKNHTILIAQFCGSILKNEFPLTINKINKIKCVGQSRKILFIKPGNYQTFIDVIIVLMAGRSCFKRHFEYENSVNTIIFLENLDLHNNTIFLSKII